MEAVCAMLFHRALIFCYYSYLLFSLLSLYLFAASPFILLSLTSYRLLSHCHDTNSCTLMKTATYIDSVGLEPRTSQTDVSGGLALFCLASGGEQLATKDRQRSASGEGLPYCR